jgi:hypothetical protein
MTAVLPDNDAKFTAWMKRHSKKDKRGSARKKFADSWAKFSADFGPLSDKLDSKTFYSCASDLQRLMREASGLRVEMDDQELRGDHYGKVARARAAGAQVTDGVGKNEKDSPDLFSALAYAIEHSHDFGVRYRICEETTCERLYVLPRTTKRFCSDACKQTHYRLAKQR